MAAKPVIPKEFEGIAAKTHSEQAIWWLNGFWEQGAKEEAENIWDFVERFKEIEYGGKVIERKGKGKDLVASYQEGSSLDEFKAHKFLESLGQVLTVIELRKRLAEIDVDKNNRMSLVEYLCFSRNKTPQQLVDAPQGGNEKELKEAQEKFAHVQASLNDVQTRLTQQKQALEEAKATKEAADKALKEAEETLAAQKKAEAEVKAAEAELQAAVDDLKKQEDDYKGKIATLEAQSEDQSLGQVARNKAKNQLAQTKSEDPLPLRKAKITQEAALKRVQKERQKAEAATAAADEKARQSAAAAEAAKAAQLELEEQTRQLEKAEAELSKAFAEAEKVLEDLKKKGGVAHGAIWWMERGLKEARKFMKK
jgi:chromosome segregation ATPase